MKTFAKVIFFELLRIFLFPLRILKIRKNRVLFAGLTGGTGNEYTCNPKYMCEYLMEHAPGAYEIIWAVSDPEKYRFLEKKGIRLVRHFSLASFPYLMTAKVIVSSGSYAPWFPFRKGQYFIHTWHGGGAYKKVENDMPGANWATRRRADFCAKNISLFVSSSKAITKKLIRGAFTYRGEVMEVGMPRNDFLVRGELGGAVKRVREFYHIDPEEKVVLYAPTYRSNEKEVRLDADALLGKLEAGGERWRFFYRFHRYAGTKIAVVGERAEKAADYPEMQELLAATDLLLTDYSSSIWDYSFLYRPCFLYVPDLDEYVKKTGFYLDIHRWQFPLAKDQEELHALIEAYDPAENRRRIKEHHRLLGSTETGESCRYIAQKIAEVCG